MKITVVSGIMYSFTISSVIQNFADGRDIYFGYMNKAFRRVETLFVQGNQVRTDLNKPPFLLPKRRFVLISTNLITLDE